MIRKSLKAMKKSFYEPSIEEWLRSWNKGMLLTYDSNKGIWEEIPIPPEES